MLHKIEDKTAQILVGLLAILPLIFKVFQDGFHIAVPDADAVLVNLVFLFFCFSGIITWRSGRHLSLASLLGKAPDKIRAVFFQVRACAVSFVITALFFDSFCQMVNPEQLSNTAWGIPLKIFFAFLPLCYFGIEVFCLKEKEGRLASVLGIFFGFFVALGPFTGILYYLFGVQNAPALYKLNDLWISFSETAFIPAILFFILLAFIGLPLFIVISGITYVAFSQAGGYVDVIPLETYRILTDKSVAAIPLFTIAGYILSQGSAGKRFVALFNAAFGWFRGGTVVAAVIVMAFFTTFTGVSGVTVLALGALLSLILTESGYTKERAESLITSCGALGLLFPPSVAIIMYATVNYFSVDVIHLFVASLLPGLLMSLAMIVLGIFFDRRKSRPAFSFSKIVQAVKECIWELLLPLIICVGYFSGFFDLFQIASFSVLYAFCLASFIRKDFTFSSTCSIVGDSIPVSGGVLFILGAAAGLSYFMLDADVPNLLASAITKYVANKYVFLILMNLLLLAVGCLMDIYSAILIVSPLLIPLAESFGITPLQSGVIFLMNLSIGFLTPPVGMDLFIASYTFKKPIGKVIKGIMPFLAVQLFVLILVTYVPWFTHAFVK
ncbi:TRAP transporter large permease subunit [Treponema parvum]|uniref:TRAP transporter large permease subunit n=1 Tax=Treponema parvum TaxID=138851 RepID=A0A975IC46_9SPIR|nr:TRAP transporter large permease subunit [Treponema parvum]QTQ11428.1 TRAP transporter large permease subunit [Treponema parvum]QTQ16631.1 TRAP transporter large permease subunit [Treponema parvum]